MTNLGNKDVFAKNLKKYMKLNGKTRNEVCQALGIKYTTFTDWVNGKKYPRMDKIEMLANYAGIRGSTPLGTTKPKPLEFQRFQGFFSTYQFPYFRR